MITSLVFPGACSELLPLLKHLEAKRIVLVKSPLSFIQSRAALKLSLANITCEILEYDVEPGRPTLSAIKRLTSFLAKQHADVLLVVGGGRVIDTAKAARMFLPKLGYMDNLTCIVVPTTAGTGSEITPFATYFQNGIKHSMDSPEMVPEYAIVDANLAKSQTNYQAACSGIDALCQSIESLWARGATEESRHHARQALSLANENLYKAALNKDPVAVEAMVLAAHASGKAIAISRTTAPHAYSYWLTVHHDIPHGHAVALFMGPILQLHTNRSDDIPYELQQLQQEVLEILEIDCRFCILCQWRERMKILGLSGTLAQLCVPEAEIGGMLSSVNKKRLGNHPVNIDNNDIRSLLLHPMNCRTFA